MAYIVLDPFMCPVQICEIALSPLILNSSYVMLSANCYSWHAVMKSKRDMLRYNIGILDAKCICVFGTKDLNNKYNRFHMLICCNNNWWWNSQAQCPCCWYWGLSVVTEEKIVINWHFRVFIFIIIPPVNNFYNACDSPIWYYHRLKSAGCFMVSNSRSNTD